MQRTSLSQKFPIGSPMPDFTLPATSGPEINAREYLKGAQASLIVFTCNHCPYVKGSEEQLVAIARRFIPDGLRVLAISSNDPLQYPEDGFDKMAEKARVMDLPYPYLFDETQQVAKKFDAECTPEFYLFNADGRLVYHGAINDSPRDPTKVTQHYLAVAIEQVLKLGEATPASTYAVGCSIKWK